MSKPVQPLRACAARVQFTIGNALAAIGFFALDFSVIRSLETPDPTFAFVNVLVGVVATAYLFATFLVMSKSG